MSLHPLTLASIEGQGQPVERRTAAGWLWRRYPCGCDFGIGPEGDRGAIWPCQYHDGFDDGVEAVELDPNNNPANSKENTPCPPTHPSWPLTSARPTGR